MLREPKPNWWLLFAILPVMIGLLLVQGWLPAGGLVHEILEMLIVVFSFGLMWLWVRVNETALAREDEYGTPFTVIYDSMEDEPLDSETVAGQEQELEPAPTQGRYN